MTDPMLGLVTVGTLCRGDMVGGLARVMVSRMGNRRCYPTQNVRVEERLVFVVLANKVVCLFTGQLSWIYFKTLCEIRVK